MLKVVACTAGYYICSVSIILFNKFLLSNSGFSFPYFVTLVYLVVKGLECGLMKWCLGLEGRQFNSWSEYFFKVVLVGASVATEICIRNLSFIYVTVALYTMVGATVPIWQLGWALAPCFKLEKFEIFLVLAIVAVALGLALVGYGATEVEPVGLFILLASVVLSGLNGVIIQGQLQNKSLLATDTASSTAQPLNPIVLTWEIAPWASLMALAFVLVFELSEMKSSEYFKSWAGLAPVLAGLCGSGTLVSIDIVLQVWCESPLSTPRWFLTSLSCFCCRCCCYFASCKSSFACMVRWISSSVVRSEWSFYMPLRKSNDHS
eukprot:SAG31_NODE_340_length_17466_cov_5.689987_10_plen_320_part_00